MSCFRHCGSLPVPLVATWEGHGRTEEWLELGYGLPPAVSASDGWAQSNVDHLEFVGLSVMDLPGQARQSQVHRT